MTGWPAGEAALCDLQRELAAAAPPAWQWPADQQPQVGGCFVCFPRGVAGTGNAGDPAWVGAVLQSGRRVVSSYVGTAAATAGYVPGLLALREGPALQSAVVGLGTLPDVLLVNATGRDHPRGAGLAHHLGAVLDVPSVGVTHRPLLATGAWPADRRGAATPLLLDGVVVGAWVRTRSGTRPLAVDAGWRTTPEQAVRLVQQVARHRTPDPIRRARQLARQARAEAGR